MCAVDGALVSFWALSSNTAVFCRVPVGTVAFAIMALAMLGAVARACLQVTQSPIETSRAHALASHLLAIDARHNTTLGACETVIARAFAIHFCSVA